MAKWDSRGLGTTISLIGLLGLLILGLVWGWREFTAPIDKNAGADASPSASCASSLPEGDAVKSSDVLVSVYNAGTRAGLADTTLKTLTERGFGKGEAGNAPASFTIATVRVLAPSAEDPAARLVALQFGPSTRILVTQDDLGPGVEVVVGDQFSGLAENAPAALLATSPGSGC